jgi:ureidoacrylate peracid hydrolase
MRGGKKHAFDMLDTAKTAHVIVDLQNGFVEEGAPVEVPTTREIFGQVNRISRAVRSAGGLNVFLRHTCDGSEKLPWNVWFGNYMSETIFAITRDAFSRDAHYWRLAPQLEVKDTDSSSTRLASPRLFPGPARWTRNSRLAESTR